MNQYKSVSEFFEEKGPRDVELFVGKNLDISDQINQYLKELGWSQKDFAEKLNKSESEISKWLGGMHNLTLRSIAKMEAVIGKDIIITPSTAPNQIEYSKTISIHSLKKPIRPPHQYSQELNAEDLIGNTVEEPKLKIA